MSTCTPNTKDSVPIAVPQCPMPSEPWQKNVTYSIWCSLSLILTEQFVLFEDHRNIVLLAVATFLLLVIGWHHCSLCPKIKQQGGSLEQLIGKKICYGETQKTKTAVLMILTDWIVYVILLLPIVSLLAQYTLLGLIHTGILYCYGSTS